MLYSRNTKILVGLLCVGIILSGVPLDLSEKVYADETIIGEGDLHSAECSYRSVEDYEYVAEVSSTAQWPGHANIEITFNNTGDKTIHDWRFTFDYNYNIENPYNCNILEYEDNLYTIGNNDWNQDILPGESITIGFTAVSDDVGEIEEEPSFFLLNTKTISLPSSDLIWSFEQYSDWTTGFSGALILTNNSEKQIRDWSISFDSNRPIIQVDAALSSSNDDNFYSITNDGNNQNISVGQSYRIEVQGGDHDPSEEFVLTNYTVYAKALAYTLDEDSNDNGIADVLEIDYSGIVTVTPTATPTSIPTATSTPVVTSTPVPTETPTVIPTSTPTATTTPIPTPTITATPSASVTPTPTATPTGIPGDIDYEKDSDSDGLPDDLEDYYGTDKNNPDTDSDGVNDFYEFILSTDPLTSDSNGTVDFDGDGLTNARESELGTNPTVQDTDLDGLSDGEEANMYGTDPVKYDTDDDGMSDYSEIYLGSSATIPDSDVKRYQTLVFEPSEDSALTGVTKVTVSGYISGSMSENTTIKDIYGKDLHTSSIEALVGDPVNIETRGEFDSMNITFKYSDGLNENNLRIMWYDEQNCEYVVLDNYSINKSRNTISVTTTHFSKYMLIDEEVWVNTWIDACCEAGYISNIGNAYSLPLYTSRLNNRYDDNDGDGLVDVLETSGMINNIGHVVYTDPDFADTDNDELSDGYEMGEFGVVGDIISYSKYTKYLDAWPVSLGSRYEDYVFLKQKSNPMLYSSDSDDVGDGVDATINDENEAINYIIYDNTDINCIEIKNAYSNYFESNRLNYQAIPIYTYYQFRDFFTYLEYGFEYEIASDLNVKGDLSNLDKVQYSHVENIILVFHGGYANNKELIITAKDADGDTDFVLSTEIKDALSNCSSIKINNIDCICCYSAKYDSDTPCIAIELLKESHADTVYGVTGKVRYYYGYFQVAFGTYDRYFINDRGNVEKWGGFMGFNLMDRYPCESDYSHEIKNYPSGE